MKIFRNITALSLLALTLAGCNLDEQADCPPLTAVRVVIPASRAGEIDPRDVRTIDLFIFDGDELYLERRSTALNQREEFDYPEAGNLHVIALGNAGETESVSDYDDEDNYNLGHGRITLLPGVTRADELIHSMPGDLFWGRELLVNDRFTEEEKELPVDRMTASINIRAIDLKEFSRKDDWEFYFEVVSDYNSFDFTGEPQTPEDGKVRHPLYEGYEQVGNVFYGPLFNVISDRVGAPFTVRVYHADGTLIDEVARDDAGNPLTTVNGQSRLVTLDYSGRHIDDGTVSVSITPGGWGDAFPIEKPIGR